MKNKSIITLGLYACMSLAISCTPTSLIAETEYEETPTPEQTLEIVEAYIEHLREQCEPLFTFLANPDVSDDDLETFAHLTFDQAPKAQEPITKETTIETARQMQTLIRIFGYSDHANTIVHNLSRIASISNNLHVAALVEYLQENKIDLGNPNATIE